MRGGGTKDESVSQPAGVSVCLSVTACCYLWCSRLLVTQHLVIPTDASPPLSSFSPFTVGPVYQSAADAVDALTTPICACLITIAACPSIYAAAAAAAAAEATPSRPLMGVGHLPGGHSVRGQSTGLSCETHTAATGHKLLPARRAPDDAIVIHENDRSVAF